MHAARLGCAPQLCIPHMEPLTGQLNVVILRQGKQSHGVACVRVSSFSQGMLSVRSLEKTSEASQACTAHTAQGINSTPDAAEALAEPPDAAAAALAAYSSVHCFSDPPYRRSGTMRK